MSTGNIQEKIIIELSRIMDEQNCEIFEAAVLFCEDEEIDIDDFIKNIDDVTLARLRQNAVQERMVRKCVHNVKSRGLDF